MHTLTHVTGSQYEVVSSPVEVSKGVRIGGLMVPEHLVTPIPVEEAQAMVALFESPAQQAAKTLAEKSAKGDDLNNIFDSFALFAEFVPEKVETAKAVQEDDCPDNACLDSCFPFVVRDQQ